ncbi:UDP-glucosyltransferase 2-like [Battus philenor]|uniref:UDP-glucosyltransferase 2-like n=1 Tax=Battus philenor TaxID=42288 RepID=UPI0035D028CF
MTYVVLSVFIIIGTIFQIEAARILALYPCASYSHQIVFRPITLELLKNGHQVTVVTPNPMFSKGNAPANLTEIDVSDELYRIIQESKNIDSSSITGNKSDLIGQAIIVKNFIMATTESVVNIREFKDLLLKNESKSFDLLMIEALFAPLLAVSHVFKAPTIVVSSFGAFIGNYEMVGAPTHPLLYHNMYSQRLYNLTVWEKMIEVYHQFRINLMYISSEGEINEFIKRLFGADTPPLSVLRNNIDLLFLNVHPIWEGNFPVPPNVIHLGGLHQKPPKSLPQDLQHYLDASNNGVIYISFGTNVNSSSLNQDKMAIFEKVFAELPYNIIWKTDRDDLSQKLKNVKTSKWLPQADLLRHPNIKLFITQGGLQSTDEAITAGVPLVGVPILGDQWYNVEKYVYHGIGVRLYLEDLTEDMLKNAIMDVAENDRYRKNIVRLRSLMLDQPQTPLERAIWWIEYVLRHGGAKHLRSPAANISWAQYYEIELIGILVLIVFIKIALIIILKRFILSYIWKIFLRKGKLKTM